MAAKQHLSVSPLYADCKSACFSGENNYGNFNQICTPLIPVTEPTQHDLIQQIKTIFRNALKNTFNCIVDCLTKEIRELGQWTLDLKTGMNDLECDCS